MLQGGAELIYVLKIAVDGGKANIGDFVNLLEPLHDEFTDFTGSPLTLRRIHHKLFNIVYDVLHLAHGNRALFARPQQSRKDLLALELLPASIFFHNHVRDFVNALVSGKALLALQTLAPSANRFAFFALARVHHLVIFEPAKRTFHGLNVSTFSGRSNLDSSKGAGEK